MTTTTSSRHTEDAPDDRSGDKVPKILLNCQYLPSSRPWWTPEGEENSPFSLETFIRQAQQAESAGVDAIFQADFSGLNRENLRAGPPVSAFEPFQLSALVAASTQQIAVMPTVSTLYTHPFTFARNLASLDRIAEGRAWINVVSSFRDGTAIGMKRDVPVADRHRQTEEFLSVASQLWHSWPPDALVPDRSTHRYIRTDLITDVDHEGTHYQQHGSIDIAPYSSRFPFTLEATSSLEGLRLAARTADAVFAGTPTPGAARELRRILRREAAAAGRATNAVDLLPGAFLTIDDSPADDTAWERRQRRQLVTAPRAVEALRNKLPRLTLGSAGPDDPMPATVIDSDPDVVFAELGSRYLPAWDIARRPGLTVGEFAIEVLSLGEHVRFSGNAEQVGAEMRQWVDDGCVDGFQLILGTGFDAVCEHVVPRLRGVRR